MSLDKAAARLRSRRALALTVLLSAGCGATAFVVLSLTPPTSVGSGVVLTVALTFGFFVAEGLPVHIPSRRETHTISLVEIPLILGLAFAQPLVLVAARLLGSGSALLAIRRQRSLVKFGFNLAMFSLETVTAATIYRVLSDGAVTTHPRAWLAGGAALLAFQVVGSLMVTAVLAINHARPSLQEFIRNFTIGLLGAAGAASWGLVAIAVIASAPLAVIPLATLAVGLYWLLGIFGELRSRHEDLKVVHSFTITLDSISDADELPGVFLEAINDHFMTSTSILISTDDDTVLSQDDTTGMRAITATEPIALADFGSGDPVLLSSDAAAAIERRTTITINGGAMVPIPSTRASVVLGNPRPGHSLGKPQLSLLQTLAAHAGSVFERHRLFGALAEEAELRQYQALHDDLTDLPNRAAFLESVGKLLRSPQPDFQIAVLLLDIDDFKTINDTLSHRAGDHLLVDMAARLLDVLRSADIVARVGGDEFAAAIRVGSDADAIAVAHRVKEDLQHPFISEGLKVEVGASVGIAIGASTAITMLRQADIAMYAAKGSDVGIEIYRKEIDEYDAPRLELAGELREAIDAGQIVVYYQPKVRPGDGRIVGFEALARWVHPTRGIVSPVEFIPIAEQTGLMTPFTKHILNTALTDLASWPDPDWTVSVNFSSRTLVGSTAQHMVSEALAHAGVPASRLVVEVTEGGILQERHGALNAIEQLHELGVLISIDDFGTGYSSMSRLATLPIDELKIDRAFISTFETDGGNRAIVETTIDLAQRLGLTTVAEGAEEVSTVEELRRLGIDEIQGYFYSPPLPIDRLLDWIDSHHDNHGLRKAG